MPFITANNIKIYYEQRGQGDDVVLISGLAADHNTWAKLVHPLSKKFRILTFDNRGAGQTDAPSGPYSSQLMAEDTVALMQALNIESAHIIGHSLGGYIAQYIALNNPNKVKTLVICSSKAYTNTLAKIRQENNVKLIHTGIDKKLLIENSLPWLFADEFLSHPDNIKNVIHLSLSNPYPQSEIGYQAQVAATLNHDTRTLLHLIKSKTLVISGTEDIYTPAENSEYIAKKIPNAILRLIKNCGHIPQIEKSEELCHLLIEFLTSPLSSKSS